MKAISYFSLLFVLILLTACGSEPSTPPPTTPNTSGDTLTTARTETPAPAPKLYYAWVDNLNLREAPKTSAKVVAKVSAGEAMTDLGEMTDFTEKIKLRGKTFDEPWVKVELSNGTVGWVFGGAVKREGEIKGVALKVKGVIDIPHFGRHDLRVWAKESVKDGAGGDAEHTTTVYTSGNWKMETMNYETGEYGYGKHYRLRGPENEMLKAYNLEWISDQPNLLKETVWDFTVTPAKKYVREETFEKHFMQFKSRPESVDGDFVESSLSPEEAKKELEYL